MKPPFSYYGGKTRLAPWIVSMLPAHRVYVEPFAGSLAVLMDKPPARFEVVNDLDGALVCFWRVLRDKPAELERACALTPHARSEYTTALDDPAMDDVERARRFWVRISQSFNQTPSRITGWSISTARGAPEVRSQLSTLGRFAGVAMRLRDVSIECAPAIEVITRTSWVADALVYCDPPYVFASRATTSGAYAHEMSNDDHRALAEVLRTHPGTVVLSGYPSDLYGELYGDWWRTDTTVVRRASNMQRAAAAKTTAIEVLWSNRDLSRELRLEGIA